MTTTTTYVLCTAVLGAVVTLLARLPRRQIVKLPGPPPSSWFTGNLTPFLHAENVGDTDSEYMEKHGPVFEMRGTFNESIFYLADPKGIQHVLNTCGYTFYKMPFLFRLLAGPGLLGVEGEDHARQRKILLPGFSHGVLKEFVPLFLQTAQKAAGQWRDLVSGDSQSSSMIDVYASLSRITLDAIGHAAFNYDFGALDDANNELVKVYRNLFVDMFHKPSDAQLVVGAIFGKLPLWTIPVLRSLPGKSMKRLKAFQTAATKVAATIVQREEQALAGGLPPGRDIMGILVRANRSEDPKSRLNNEELMSQMMSLMVAGHDTTSASLVWTFYELSRHPEVQAKLREEIRNARVTAAATGREELSVVDFESMTYTVAVIKETLRFYPIAAHNMRTAGRNEIIPLTRSIETVSGEKITALPVRKGQKVLMSIWAYNRIKSLWGDDADEWNPARFLASDISKGPKNSLGVYANLATFSSGVHSCIGWRFAVLEMQAILIAMVESFEISPPPSDHGIIIVQALAPTLVPMVKCQEARGAQMPLTITAIN